MKNDWIALVEAGYDLDGSDQDWLDRLFDRAEPLLDPGIGARRVDLSLHADDLSARALPDARFQTAEGHASCLSCGSARAVVRHDLPQRRGGRDRQPS